jgi:PPOX class probable F420-dependent enzyme
MESAEARRLFATVSVARLASVRPDGAPHLVPVCFAVDGETLYTAVDAKPKTTKQLARLRHIVAEPRVAVLADHYEDNWTRLWWVRMDGRARIVDDPAERERALALLAGRYPQYRDTPPDGPVIAVDADRWSGWRAENRGVS